MRRRLPPAGGVLGMRDVWGAGEGVLSPGRARRDLCDALRKVTGEMEVFPVSSGRAGLYQTFQACKKENEGARDVVISAYTCWSVAAAALRAGLRLHLVDIDPGTLDFGGDLERSSPESPLAVVTHNLFGFPNDLSRAAAAAGRWGARLVDDAAQGFGAEIGGGGARARADATVLSFGRGKALPALGGGAVLFPEGNTLARAWERLAKGGRGSRSLLRAWAYRIFFSRTCYRYPAALPFLRIGETTYDERFPVREIDGYTARLAARILPSLRRERETRKKAAEEYDAMIRALPGVRRVQPLAGAAATYLRYPLLLPPEKKGALLRAAGRLGVSPFYPGPITSIRKLCRESVRWTGSLEGSEEVARSLVTLPTHSLVTAEERAAIVRTIAEVCRC